MRNLSRVIIFVGPPGAGKGTQAARLAAELRIPAVSTGELLRQAARSRSELGRLVGEVMSSGSLVSDDLINRVVAERLHRDDCKCGCILDGYPRTVSQAHFLQALLDELNLPEPAVVHLDLPEAKTIRRLSRRRQCSACGGIFSMNRGAESVRCPYDGTLLVQRADDHPAAIRHRIQLYRSTFSGLIEFYRAGNYHDVDASRDPSQIFDELMGIVGRPIPSTRVPSRHSSLGFLATA